jgi:hypothetical protein
MIELIENMGYFYFCYQQKDKQYYNLYISKRGNIGDDRYIWDYGHWI